MTTARHLFDSIPEVPAAAHSDPATSHEAIAEHTTKGRREKHASIVLRLVTEHSGCTGHELFEAATDAEKLQLGNHFELYRRANDLHRTRKIRHGPVKVCRIRNRRMVTWELC